MEIKYECISGRKEIERESKKPTSSMVYSLNKKPFIAETYAMKYKSKVNIRLGKPITIENHFDGYKTNKKEAVNKLTEIINKEVNSQTNLIF